MKVVVDRRVTEGTIARLRRSTHHTRSATPVCLTKRSATPVCLTKRSATPVSLTKRPPYSDQPTASTRTRTPRVSGIVFLIYPRVPPNAQPRGDDAQGVLNEKFFTLASTSRRSTSSARLIAIVASFKNTSPCGIDVAHVLCRRSGTGVGGGHSQSAASMLRRISSWRCGAREAHGRPGPGPDAAKGAVLAALVKEKDADEGCVDMGSTGLSATMTRTRT
ncbi:hypothetical protein B0H19DRAFT_1376711 [Mycena capillaripes]|nr:hypothetical protein B0H19DRAFT_1376711 [Mycena capillaripes]